MMTETAQMADMLREGAEVRPQTWGKLRTPLAASIAEGLVGELDDLGMAEATLLYLIPERMLKVVNYPGSQRRGAVIEILRHMDAQGVSRENAAAWLEWIHA